ncbi:MAG: 3-hydroxyacyl-CoA dehydrogenase NAD-binding domain-containing protein [Rhodospirillales bacterium]
MIPFERVRRIALIGGGTIGASWAAWFLARGYDVALSDPAEDGESRSRAILEAAWPAMQRLGLAEGAALTRFSFHSEALAAAEGADFVQENAPERLAIKEPLLKALDAALPADRVIASSTSSFMPSLLQAAAQRHPERILVGHPFNPPHLVPLVEVVGGPGGSTEAVDWAVGFYRRIGKTAIRVEKEISGHIANRLQAALFREAAYLLQQGVASVEDLDRAVADGPGLRWAMMGPLMTFNLGGGPGGMRHFLAQFEPTFRDWFEELGQPELTPALSQALVDGVEAEMAGRSLAELTAWRDETFLRLLEAVRPPTDDSATGPGGEKA